MRVEGRWHLFDDGILRPVLDAVVKTPAGDWQPVMLLVDGGADRTVFDSSWLPVLRSLALSDVETPELGGVGGKAKCLFIQTRLAFTRDDRRRVSVQGAFAVFTDTASSDVAVLGRDVTNNFDVIYSYPQREVIMLTAPHIYQVLPPA